MSKYEEIMEYVNIDEKMQDRILSHIDEHFEKKASRSSRRRFYTICATAAAAVLIVCVVNMQGGSSTSTIVGSNAMITAQEHATDNSLDEVIEKAVAQESKMLAATSPALYKAAENDLAGAAAPDSENTGSSDTLSESAADAPAVSSSITSTTQPVETMPALTLYEPIESNYVLAGGYTRAASPVITDEIRAMCEKAFASMTEATYEPVALLATQVVAGTNYCILCESTATDSVKTYVFVYIYEDLEGNATCTEIKDTGIEVYY